MSQPETKVEPRRLIENSPERISLPLFSDFSLELSPASFSPFGYPTRRLQKGWGLVHGSVPLVEEAVGFGVPILKKGLRAVFPGGIRLDHRRTGATWEVDARFQMNLEEGLSRRGQAITPASSLHTAKEALASLHRHAPALRGLLNLFSNSLRRLFDWETTYVESASQVDVAIAYTVHGDEGRIGVVADLSNLPRESFTELVLMNEQGAHFFDGYRDSDGASIRGKRIGSWDRVAAQRASFISSAHGIAFSLHQVDGAALFRGREVVGSRLAWAGFGYSVPAERDRFAYDLILERAP
jgi:hypothetical protein